MSPEERLLLAIFGNAHECQHRCMCTSDDECPHDCDCDPEASS